MSALFAQGEVIAQTAKTATDRLIEGGTLAVVVLFLLAVIGGILYMAARILMPAVLAQWKSGEVWYQTELKRKDELHEIRQKESGDASEKRFKEQADAFIGALARSDTVNREQGERFLLALKEMRVDQREELKAVVTIATANIQGVHAKLDTAIIPKVEEILKILSAKHENPRRG